MYQKIMVPVDDSKTALRALEEACHVAQAVGASVYAVHVVDLAQFNWGTAEFGDSLALRRAVEEAGEKVLAHTSGILNAGKVPHETAILESGGDKIADLLLDAASEQQVDLIVMGTHGFSGLLHLLLGSVAEGVVRKSPVPVLLVRSRDED